MPPHFVGGMGVVSYQLCQHLAKTGADIEFILPFEAEFNIDFMKVNPVKKGVTYDFLHNHGAASYGKASVKNGEIKTTALSEHVLEAVNSNYAKKAARLATLGEYDVIHAHDWMTFRAALAAKQVSGLPLVVHVHATEFDRAGNNAGDSLKHEIEYLGMSMADKVIAVSNFTKNVIVKRYGISPGKIEVVHNSIDIGSQYEDRDDELANSFTYLERKRQQGFRVVTNVGRVTIQKGLGQLLDAAALALKHNPKIIFLLVGSGDLKLEMIQKAADLGIGDKVIFTEFLKGKQWRDAFKISDLFVMPSVSEPFGITVLEAIGFGAPVMLSNQSGASEILSNVLKVDFWDTHAMANNIVAVTTNDSLREELHANSHTEYLSQNWMQAAEKTTQVYEKAMAIA